VAALKGGAGAKHAFGPDVRFVLVTSNPGTRLWDAATGNELAAYRVPDDFFGGAGFLSGS